MNCPHCLVEFHEETESSRIVSDVNGSWYVVHCVCPKCRKSVIFLNCRGERNEILKALMVRPKGASRSPLSEDVPARFAEDYLEACMVLTDSPKASAALSRRCLQDILREVAKVKKADLHEEIQELLDSKKLPSGTADAIDAVRAVGNFAAHPLKSKQTGTIISVEPGEAELLLEVIEELFDFYFVRPARLKSRLVPINQKLRDLGKPEVVIRPADSDEIVTEEAEAS